jgi:hypothetical protein
VTSSRRMQAGSTAIQQVGNLRYEPCRLSCGLLSMSQTRIAQLQADVEALAKEGGRPVGSSGHGAARQYLLGRIESLQMSPYKDGAFAFPYERAGIRFVNLAARKRGTSPRNASTGALLIGAHYDTCGPTPGADDNAAAVAILLEVAHSLKSISLMRDIIFAIFDAEEPPYFLSPAMGSIRFYEDQRVEKIDCAFIMDLVGHDVPVPGIENGLFITGMESHPDLATVLEQTPPHPQLRTVPTLNEYVGDMSDHHIFRMRGVPYLFFSCGHWRHYHQTTDTADRLNYCKMAATAQHLTELILAADAQPLGPLSSEYDSTPAELRLMNRSLGPLLRAGGRDLLKSREHITALAMELRSFGL